MKILIIDDEPLIHLSIKHLIHRVSPDIEVFHAYNGKEMLDLLQKHHFLLAYVDIKLPGISGLEAIRQAKEISSDTVYYIMTGYDTFEFAKEAIKLKVEDYLMKPLDLNTIQSTVTSAQRIYDANIREKKSLFRHWMESVLNAKECILEKYNQYYRFALLITMDKSDFPVEQVLDKFMVYNDSIVSTLYNDHILLLCFSENAEHLRTISNSLTDDLTSSGITIFTSSIVRSSREAKHNIENLIRYSCMRVITGIENYYAIKPMQNYEDSLKEFCHTCESWKQAYQSKNYNAFTALNETICSQLEQMDSLKKYRDHSFYYMGAILNEPIPKTCSQDELRTFLQKQAAKLLQTSGSERLVDSIIQYINEHYCDNLSATMLSEQFGLSSNYITNLLKQELGIRYNDYITQLRMEHAKELLCTTSQSVKSITSACGYYSQSHFTKLFVEREGCTPLEYRKQMKP